MHLHTFNYIRQVFIDQLCSLLICCDVISLSTDMGDDPAVAFLPYWDKSATKPEKYMSTSISKDLLKSG